MESVLSSFFWSVHPTQLISTDNVLHQAKSESHKSSLECYPAVFLIKLIESLLTGPIQQPKESKDLGVGTNCPE